MKKKSNSNSQQLMTLVIVLALLVVVLFYVFVYKDMVTKAEKMRGANAELSQRVIELKDYFEKQDEYKNLIEEYKSDIKTVLGNYPELVLEEDAMMQAYNSMIKANKLAYTSIAMVEPESVYTIPAETVAAVNLSEGEDDSNSDAAINFIKKNTAYVASCDYPSFISMIKDVIDRPGRTVIKNILFDKNKEFNDLEGTIEIDYFYIPTFGYEYKPVDMTEYTKGMEALFVLKEETDEEDKEDKEEE